MSAPEMTEQAKKRAAVYEMAKKRREAWNKRFERETEDGEKLPPLLTLPETLTDNEVSMWYAILRLEDHDFSAMKAQERVHASPGDEERDLKVEIEAAKTKSRAAGEDLPTSLLRIMNESQQESRAMCEAVGHLWGGDGDGPTEISCRSCDANGVVISQDKLRDLLRLSGEGTKEFKELQNLADENDRRLRELEARVGEATIVAKGMCGLSPSDGAGISKGIHDLMLALKGR